jgi:hypothetical protein
VERKFKNIPIMKDYDCVLPENFWSNFPVADLPKVPLEKIDIDRLEYLVESCKPKLLASEYQRALKCIDYLRIGAPSFQLSNLPACLVKNSSIALNHGPAVTDVLASWVSKKFVAGPFKSPPLPNFRANSILAVPQTNKVRVCLNVSLPVGKSFNDNIDVQSLERVKMTSARCFGFAILRAGKDATMLKFDKADAYKNVPCRIGDLNKQGFCWGGRYFVETRQIFGSKASVQNYDIIGNTVKTIVHTSCRIPRDLALRQLDDVPVVAPASSGWCEEFSAKYKELCADIKLELAPPCPNFDKAFDCSKFGKVLGIIFDTRNLTWKLPKDKVESTLRTMAEIVDSQVVKTKQLQCLMGKLNHVAQMSPFLNCFKHPLNMDLAECIKKGWVVLTNQSVDDLRVWSAVLQDMEVGLPICPPMHAPPLCTKVFTSDAAGLGDKSVWEGEIGCGTIGLKESGDTLLAFQTWWPKEFVTKKVDAKGKRFGNKTATLEMVGVLLPFLLIPKELENQHVVLQVDNMACVYGCENRYMKGDVTASILVKALHLIGAFLGSVVHVVHVPRCSSWESVTADRLSRERTTGFLEKQMLFRFNYLSIPSALAKWLENPKEDWNLAHELLHHVQNTM